MRKRKAKNTTTPIAAPEATGLQDEATHHENLWNFSVLARIAAGITSNSRIFSLQLLADGKSVDATTSPHIQDTILVWDSHCLPAAFLRDASFPAFWYRAHSSVAGSFEQIRQTRTGTVPGSASCSFLFHGRQAVGTCKGSLPRKLG